MKENARQHRSLNTVRGKHHAQGLKTVCLDDIFVLPAYRRREIAAKLFSEVDAWDKEEGVIRLELHTWDLNRGAIAMYKAMGMTPQRYVFEKKL